jgi:hypothetical protein
MPCNIKKSCGNTALITGSLLVSLWSVLELDCEHFGTKYLGVLCDLYDNNEMIKTTAPIALLSLSVTGLVYGVINCTQEKSHAPEENAGGTNTKRSWGIFSCCKKNEDSNDSSPTTPMLGDKSNNDKV